MKYLSTKDVKCILRSMYLRRHTPPTDSNNKTRKEHYRLPVTEHLLPQEGIDRGKRRHPEPLARDPPPAAFAATLASRAALSAAAAPSFAPPQTAAAPTGRHLAVLGPVLLLLLSS